MYREERMKQPLWQPTDERIKNTNMTKFIEFVNERHNKQFKGYFDLYEWSVTSISDFWAAVWDFVDIRASRKYDKVVEDLSTFPGTKWFPGAELNFAENLLKIPGQLGCFCLQV